MKGKYAARSTLRREDNDIRSQIESYQHAVKRLTAENEELKTALAAENAGRKQEARRLKAQLDEGLSPELIALRKELERQRGRAGKAETDARRTREIWSGVYAGVRRLLQDGLGLTSLEAAEVIMSIDGLSPPAPGADPAFIADDQLGTRSKANLTREQALTIQARQGARSRTDVVKFLRNRMDAVVNETRP